MQRALFPAECGLNDSFNTHRVGNGRYPLSPLHRNGHSVHSVSNGHNGHKSRFEASDESMNEEDLQYELTFSLLPVNIQKAPYKVTVSIPKEIVDDNDWTRLHALIYEELMDRMDGDGAATSSADAMRKYRESMIVSPHYEEERHYLYYGRDLVRSVQRHNKRDEQRIPRAMPTDIAVTVPMFEALELAQSDKILHLRPIARDWYNVRIEDYTARHGIRRMVVQQLPDWWSDPKLKDAQKVAEYLDQHDVVSWVKYAGLPDNPYHVLAGKYLPKGAGSILTFGIKGGQEAGVKFIENAEFMSHVANVGDAKTLIIHPASTTHRQLNEEEQASAGVSPDMIRISVGLESIDDILWDIDQSIAASQS